MFNARHIIARDSPSNALYIPGGLSTNGITAELAKMMNERLVLQQVRDELKARSKHLGRLETLFSNSDRKNKPEFALSMKQHILTTPDKWLETKEM